MNKDHHVWFETNWSTLYFTIFLDRKKKSPRSKFRSHSPKTYENSRFPGKRNHRHLCPWLQSKERRRWIKGRVTEKKLHATWYPRDILGISGGPICARGGREIASILNWTSIRGFCDKNRAQFREIASKRSKREIVRLVFPRS